MYKITGKYDVKGWDIPVEYAVDTEGMCWMNSAHGDPMVRVNYKQLIADAEEQGAEDAVQKINEALGIVYEPQWMRIARNHGWTPPNG